MIQRAKIKKIAFILYLAAVHILAGFYLYDKFFHHSGTETAKNENNAVSPVVPLPTPVTVPFEANNLPPENKSAEDVPPANQQPQQNAPVAPVAPGGENPENGNDTGKLMIPVVGIRRDNLLDTYTQSRSGGRVHNAIDIMAPVGAPVVAVADGEIVKFFDSKLGGITIYQYSADKKYVYYYAHLQKRADNLQEKTFVKQGTLLGYVGDTGNAGAGNYHLHFSIIIPTDPETHWDGTNINPYPMLKNGVEASLR